ncbi:MAG: hypothetical protein SFV17_08220 [Candidatus Obscuribacter sp.]|nr:hypothetical protein [Candidatus Melainabacteria bacterium]MDX1986657.1 hypothetical protein [Candidatus Obscuribacter sp.]
MQGLPNFRKSLLLSALLVSLGLISCQQGNKPVSEQAPTVPSASLNGTANATLERVPAAETLPANSQQSAQRPAPAIPQPAAMQDPPARPAGADALAILKKSPKDLTADDCKKIDGWSGQGVKEVMDALNSAREAAITSATDTSTIRGACLNNHKVGIPYG